MHKNVLDLIRLLDAYAHPHAVHRGFDEHPFLGVAADCERIEKEFGRGRGFDFGDVVAFAGLGGEVGQGEGGGEGGADRGEVWT